ncbi:hypothetical protein JL720_15709 [Aureococcus anophagefferens]|nr:hypothetical protein JL720_15709 [Aureococcus anophagefferens]
MSSSWDKISAGRVLDMAEAKHLQVHDDAGNLVPAMRRGSTRVLGAARGLDADAARADGAYYELEFAEPRLGFTVALARHHAASASPRSPRARSWCTLSVEDMSDERLFESRLRPRDEVVTLAGQAVAIRDDDGYDDAQRYAAFGRIKAQIRDAAPVTLGFAEGAGRDAAAAAAAKATRAAAKRARTRVVDARLGYAARDPDFVLEEARRTRLRRRAKAALAAAPRRPPPPPPLPWTEDLELALLAWASDHARPARARARRLDGRAAAFPARRTRASRRSSRPSSAAPTRPTPCAGPTRRRGARPRARAAPLPFSAADEAAIREWARRAIVGADGRDAVDWAGAAAALFPGRGVDAAQIAETTASGAADSTSGAGRGRRGRGDARRRRRGGRAPRAPVARGLDRCLAAERRVRASPSSAPATRHVQALIEAAAFRCAAADERGVAVEAKRLAASPR